MENSMYEDNDSFEEQLEFETDMMLKEQEFMDKLRTNFSNFSEKFDKVLFIYDKMKGYIYDDEVVHEYNDIKYDAVEALEKLKDEIY